MMSPPYMLHIKLQALRLHQAHTKSGELLRSHASSALAPLSAKRMHDPLAFTSLSSEPDTVCTLLPGCRQKLRSSNG